MKVIRYISTIVLIATLGLNIAQAKTTDLSCGYYNSLSEHKVTDAEAKAANIQYSTTMTPPAKNQHATSVQKAEALAVSVTHYGQVTSAADRCTALSSIKRDKKPLLSTSAYTSAYKEYLRRAKVCKQAANADNKHPKKKAISDCDTYYAEIWSNS